MESAYRTEEEGYHNKSKERERNEKGTSFSKECVVPVVGDGKARRRAEWKNHGRGKKRNNQYRGQDKMGKAVL